LTKREKASSSARVCHGEEGEANDHWEKGENKWKAVYYGHERKDAIPLPFTNQKGGKKLVGEKRRY